MPLVFGVCLKYLKDRDESKDAVMQIFEKLFTVLKTHQIENFKSWLHVTTKNHCLMALRKSGKFAGEEKIDENVMELSYSAHHEDEQSLENDISALKRCIETLKDQQKACIVLFFLEKKCYNEITEITEYSLKNVKSHIQNGKRNLKICMEQGG